MVYCYDVEAKCWQTFHMPKCSVKILWTALWLLLNGSPISLNVKGWSDFIIWHNLCSHLLLPCQVFLNVVHLQLHPAFPDSPCAIKYFPLWSRLVLISSFQLLIHFPCTFLEFDAKFIGHNIAHYSCVHFYDAFNKHTIFTSWLLGTHWMDRVSLCFVVWATLQASSWTAGLMPSIFTLHFKQLIS